MTYVDGQGKAFEQPADLVLLTSYVFSNIRLMLLSGIGKPLRSVERARAWSAATTRTRW